MKNLLFLLSSLTYISTYAQDEAIVTTTGEKIIVLNDRTWSYKGAISPDLGVQQLSASEMIENSEPGCLFFSNNKQLKRPILQTAQIVDEQLHPDLLAIMKIKGKVIKLRLDISGSIMNDEVNNRRHFVFRNKIHTLYLNIESGQKKARFVLKEDSSIIIYNLSCVCQLGADH